MRDRPYKNLEDWKEFCRESGAARFETSPAHIYAIAKDHELVGDWSFFSESGEIFDEDL